MCKAVAIIAAKGAPSEYWLEGVVNTNEIDYGVFDIHTNLRSICRFVSIFT